MIKYTYLSIVLLLGMTRLSAQDNCYAFYLAGDTCRYQACDFLEKAPSYFQLTREYHLIKDQALAICPEYSDIYRAKSTAYLKTGDFIQWKKLIDKAVELNPIEHLGYRAWCRFQFFRDYQGTIDDLEALNDLIDYNPGPCQNGFYNLNIAMALCYKMLGQKQKAIQIIEAHLADETQYTGVYDNLHLGVLYFEIGDLAAALKTFEAQEASGNLAENQYHKARVLGKLGQKEAQKEALEQALSLYQNDICMFDPYGHQVDKIFLSDIEAALNEL
ncbi:MAG: tetratricopeptide repeat protein [Saprospiraceae bacterium]